MIGTGRGLEYEESLHRQAQYRAELLLELRAYGYHNYSALTGPVDSVTTPAFQLDSLSSRPITTVSRVSISGELTDDWLGKDALAHAVQFKTVTVTLDYPLGAETRTITVSKRITRIP